jgi:hypothetical protein
MMLLMLLAMGSSAAGRRHSDGCLHLGTPRRVGFRTPELGDKYNNGSNRGIFWFPHTLTTMPDTGVLVLRVAVHPDAVLPNNDAAVYTSANRGRSFTSQTGPGCSAANTSACALPLASRGHSGDDGPTDRPHRNMFGPTLSWELSVPQHPRCTAGNPATVQQPAAGQLLGIPYQTHIASWRPGSSNGGGGGGGGSILGWNASMLSVAASGVVTVTEPRVPVRLTGLPHPVLNISAPLGRDGGGVVLAGAHAYSGEGVALPDGSLLALLTDVRYASGVCMPNKTHSCRFILAIRSTNCGRSWHYLSTVTDGGTEASMVAMHDGRLLVVFRHNFEGAPYHSVRFKQTFSVTGGRSWGAATEMRAAVGSVPPHSVMPTLKRLAGSGYLLSGGRDGMYIWYCATMSCVDAGAWVSTNVAAHHNAHTDDPFGLFPPGCLNESGWDNIGVLGCPSKSYLGLTVLGPATAAADTASFVVCYSHCSNVSSYGFCFTELGRGQEVYCVRGGLTTEEDSQSRRPPPSSVES